MDRTIQALVAAGGQRSQVAVHFSADDTAISYGELDALSCHYAARVFDAHAVAEGEVVACAMHNCRALYELLVSAFCNGRIVLPLNLASGEKALSYVVNHAAPKVVFCDPPRADLIARIAPQTKRVVVDPRSSLAPVSTGDGARPVVWPDTPALLMYTSGTTGNPKGVLLSHKNLIQGGTNTVLAHRLTQQDIGLCVLPLYHINAQCVSLMSALVAGATLVLQEKFSVHTFFPTIERYRASWASVVPTMISYLLNAMGDGSASPKDLDLSCLQFLRSASASLPVSVHRAIEKKLAVPVIETMGITEAAAQILANPRPPLKRKTGSVGFAFGNVVKIMDDQGAVLPAGVEGQICVRGNNVMAGYYRDDEASRKAFDAAGWFLTGDLGTADEEGYFYVTGRKKELIIKGGENISPREIDEVLYDHPDVVEAAAFGRFCASYGQEVEACVRKKEGSALDKSDLIILCREQLGAFKAPVNIHFMDELPKGPSGKIQRLQLEQIIYPRS